MDESNKRQRTTSSNDNGEVRIIDLPDGLLAGIASYLAKPSIALFAIAMSPNNSQSQQTKTRAIISSTNWNVLDFSDIEKSLASKLSDNDIDMIFSSIDAVNNLRILKLAGCVKITGSGLDSLSTATAIQQIDMSLVGMHEAPLLAPEPKISEDIVLPVLYSIINRGSSLRQIEFPKKWRNKASMQMTQFLDRYKQYLTNRRHSCLKCDRSNFGTEWVGIDRDDIDWYGTQNYTCSACVKHFCYDEDCNDENGDKCITWCENCEKEYCQSCVASVECGFCGADFCNECQEMKECEGEDCERTLCEGCFGKKNCHICNSMKCTDCVNSYQCRLDDCSNVICADCVDSNGVEGVCAVCLTRVQAREQGVVPRDG